MSRPFPRAILALCLLLGLAWGCSLPRLTVHEDPLSPEEHLQLGMSYEQGGELDMAMREYERAADDLPLAWLYLGNVHYVRKDTAAAEKAYRKAIEVLPGNPEPLNNLAWIWYEQGKELDRAEKLAEQAVALAPPGGEATYLDTLEKIREKRAGR
jgi:tetratricopeptide (TPR) repeat protein